MRDTIIGFMFGVVISSLSISIMLEFSPLREVSTEAADLKKACEMTLPRDQQCAMSYHPALETKS